MDSMLGGFLRDSEITHVLGLTATPLKLQTNTDINGYSFSKLVMLTSRSKKGQFFKEIIYVSQVSEMVELGFWTKLEYETYDIDEGKLVYNSTKAEFTEESIKAVYETNNTQGKILDKLDVVDRKSIIVFVPSVNDAINFAGVTPNSVAVYGDMNSKERDFAITQFKKGNIRVVFNVNVLSVGFDHPELDCIICARSTASLSWFYQAIGRGTRIAPNKKDCLIVDFSGNIKRFGKVEKLFFVKENIWKLYGEGGKLLTGCPMHEIGEHTQITEFQKEKDKNEIKVVIMPFGKFKDKQIKDIDKGYRDWMLKTFEWNKYNMPIKREIERLNRLSTDTA
jgi:DNA repair protein RadD